MADVMKLVPTVLKWEGGFVNDPLDRGGATNKGVTIVTFDAYMRKTYGKPGTVEGLKKISNYDWGMIMKGLYWDRWKADQIKDQGVANILVDWVWASGKWGIINPQRLLKVKADGIVGSKTLEAVNAFDPDELFDIIYGDRMRFVNAIVTNNPDQKRFLKGWINRINDIPRK